MTAPLLLAVSPYHLTSRDPAALAACLLADRVVTLLPTPAGTLDRAALREAFRLAPPYWRLMESWRWAAPLFESGIARSTLGSADAADDALAIRARLEDPAAWPRLGAFLHPEPLLGPAESLERLATDLLKGGPDPGLSLPLVAGLDAFATRHGGIAVRAGGATANGRRAADPGWRGSAAQQLEAGISHRVFSIGVPCLRQADGHTLLWAREVLRSTLDPLRRAVADAMASAPPPPDARPPSALPAAAREFALAFAAAIARRGPGRDGPQGEQVLDGFVRITGVRLPADAALLAGEAAAGRLGGARASPRAPARPAGHGASRTTSAGSTERALAALVIEPLAIRPHE